MPRIALLALAAVIAACGQKGALYLPGPGSEAVPATPAAAPVPSMSPVPADDDEDDAANVAGQGGAAQ